MARVCWGQTVYYCEVTTYLANKGISVYIDFGDRKMDKLTGKNSDCVPVDANNNEINFLSNVDVLNWMVDRGWKCIGKTEDFNAPFRNTFLMEKETTKEHLKEGIILKGDLKK